MAIRFGEGFFPSHNKVSKIYYCHYTPDMPKGVILLVHGMCGYAGNFDQLARTLCDNSYAVYAYDLAGHGRSVGEGEEFGTFAEENGDVVLVKDMEAMTAIIRRRFRLLPFFVFAHSLGSLITRAFAASHKDVFDGIVLSGTAKLMHFSALQRFFLNRRLKKAGRTYSPEVEKMIMGRLSSPFQKESGSWLTTNPDGMPKKGDNPYIGHKMKADGFGDMIRLLDYVSSDEWLEAMPRATPLLLMAGERDPLGGQELMGLVDTLDELEFSKVVLKLYEGEKHELLGSASHEKVVGDLIHFLNEESDAVTAMRRQTREVW